MVRILLNFFRSNPPQRPSRLESCGLRHITFEVDDLELIITHCKNNNVIAEPIRVDELTNKRFTFIAAPDNLPIEFYEKNKAICKRLICILLQIPVHEIYNAFLYFHNIFFTSPKHDIF